MTGGFYNPAKSLRYCHWTVDVGDHEYKSSTIQLYVYTKVMQETSRILLTVSGMEVQNGGLKRLKRLNSHFRCSNASAGMERWSNSPESENRTVKV